MDVSDLRAAVEFGPCEVPEAGTHNVRVGEGR